ncbi:MAG: nucleotidyltransferase domain-containing protein [Ignisphaera sp.]
MPKPYELRVLKYLENYIDLVEKIKNIVKSINPKAKMFVFGSVVRGRYIASSDIDILILVEK